MDNNKSNTMYSCPQVSIVIPTYNRAKDLPIVFDAIQNQYFHAYEVIVVDNSSTDNTEEVVNRFGSRISQNVSYYFKKPEGPASARNYGMARSRGEYVLFLDSDVELEPEWLHIAVKKMEQSPELGAIGGQIIYHFDRNQVNAFGGDLGAFGLAWDVNEGGELSTEPSLIPRFWINCSAMLGRKSACENVLGFDERFFYGFEDSDLGWKLNLSGMKTVVYAPLKAYHHVDPVTGATHPAIVFHSCKNRLASLLQCASWQSLGWRLALYVAYSFADLARGNAMAKLKALLWNAGQLPTTFKRRRHIQAQRKILDKVVFLCGEGRWFPPSPLAGQRRRAAKGHYTTVIANQADDRV